MTSQISYTNDLTVPTVVIESEAYDGAGDLVRKSVDRIVLSMDRKAEAE